MPQLYQYCILHWIHIRRWRIACISRHRHAVVIKRRSVKDTNHNSRMMLWLLVHSCCPWSVDGWRTNIDIGAPWWRQSGQGRVSAAAMVRCRLMADQWDARGTITWLIMVRRMDVGGAVIVIMMMWYQEMLPRPASSDLFQHTGHVGMASPLYGVVGWDWGCSAWPQSEGVVRLSWSESRTHWSGKTMESWSREGREHPRTTALQQDDCWCVIVGKTCVVLCSFCLSMSALQIRTGDEIGRIWTLSSASGRPCRHRGFERNYLLRKSIKRLITRWGLVLPLGVNGCCHCQSCVTSY